MQLHRDRRMNPSECLWMPEIRGCRFGLEQIRTGTKSCLSGSGTSCSCRRETSDNSSQNMMSRSIFAETRIHISRGDDASNDSRCNSRFLPRRLAEEHRNEHPQFSQPVFPIAFNQSIPSHILTPSRAWLLPHTRSVLSSLGSTSLSFNRLVTLLRYFSEGRLLVDCSVIFLTER